MDNDIKKMIEKYRTDLLKFNNAHPQRHFNETPSQQQFGNPNGDRVNSGGTGAPAVPPAPETPRPDEDPPAPKPESGVQPEMPQPPRPEQPEMPPRPVSRPEITPTPPATPEIPMAPIYVPAPPQAPLEIVMQTPAESNIFGYIQVRTFTAREATPVAGADVVITKGDTVLHQLRTDENGSTVVVELPTVSRKLSQQSGNLHPYETYDIRIKAPGYLNVISKDVPVFEGITAVQNVAMIPLPEFGSATETEYENTEPNL